jgi:hypothetical protein
MKVKGSDASLGTKFGHGIGREWLPEGRRSPRVALVSVASWSTDVISPLFGHAMSTPVAGGVLACGWLGCRLVVGAGR